MVSPRRVLSGLLVGLLLACAAGSAWAPPYARPSVRPTETRPDIRGWPGREAETHETHETHEQRVVQSLESHLDADGWPRIRYFPDVAVAAYQHGKLSVFEAEWAGHHTELRVDWLELRREKGREPNAEEWHDLLSGEKARIAARLERETEAKKAEIKAEAKSYAERTDRMSADAVEALQRSVKGRTAALGADLPGIVVRVADDPAYDRAIIEHTWTRHALALKSGIPKQELNLINLFPDPIGDILVRQIQEALGKEVDNPPRASRILNDMLTGRQPFDSARLAEALSSVQGQTFYIVSHIPEAQAGKGQLEFINGDKPILTSIAELQSAFQAAKVNLFVVGCSSSKHAVLGLSEDINNVDALTKFLEAARSEKSRSLFEWHAAFASDAQVVIDPLATKVFGREAGQHQLSGVKLEVNGRSVSYGYAGTFAVPPSVPGIDSPPSVALAVAAKTLLPPEPCKTQPSPWQHEAAARLAPAGIGLLACALFLSMFLMLKEEVLKQGNEYVGALMAPVIGGAPILISLYAWLNGRGAAFEPGPWLGVWCLAYAAISALVAAHERKLGSVANLFSALFGLSALLFGAAYFGLTADSSIRTFCNAYTQAMP